MPSPHRRTSRTPLLLTLWLFAHDARAQAGAVSDARNAILALTEGACQRAVTEGIWEVRLAVVVYPDGGWSLAVGPFGALGPVSDTTVNALRDCASRRLAETLAPRLARPPHAVTATTRVWRFPNAAQAALRGRLDAIRPEVLACARRSAPGLAGFVRLLVDRRPDGRPRVQALGTAPLGPHVARCVGNALGVVPPIEGAVEHGVAVDRPTAASEPAEPANGRAGSICVWGERRSDRASLPPPRPCLAGLRCCPAGGAAGSDAVCVRTLQCPMYP